MLFKNFFLEFHQFFKKPQELAQRDHSWVEGAVLRAPLPAALQFRGRTSVPVLFVRYEDLSGAKRAATLSLARLGSGRARSVGAGRRRGWRTRCRCVPY